jgi:hypothetical protein
MSYVKNIGIGIIMKYLYINQLYNTLNLLTLFLTNINQSPLYKILFTLLYIAIINKKAIFKIILLSYIGSVIIRVYENRLVKLETNKSINLETNKSINLETNKSINLETNKSINLETNQQLILEQELYDAMNE